MAQHAAMRDEHVARSRDHRRRRPVAVVAVLAALALGAGVVPALSPTAEAVAPPESREFVLSPEGNHLWAYDAHTGGRQLVVQAVAGTDPGGPKPDGLIHRDINGQICVSPDGTHIVTGEDTVIGSGSSHNPEIAGWGYFTIAGDALGELAVDQVGKLAPEAGTGPGYAGDPDNYGCGFLDDERLVTTAIGNTLPGDEANGQLFVWFGPFDAGFEEVAPSSGDAGFYRGTVTHCSVDDTLATAGGVAVDPANGDVYVATNRPDDHGNAGAIWRFSDLPATYEQCAADGYQVTKELVVPSIGQLPVAPASPTPSSVVISPDDTLYVSSVFTGTVTEYTKDGDFVRTIYPTSPVTAPTGPTTQTPFGLAVTADGSLWIADLGILVAFPAPGQGSLIRVRFDDAAGVRQPRPAGETVADGLTFPDGLGVYRPPAHTSADSEWPCGDWGMYGRTLSRQFSVDEECRSPIGPDSVRTLAPLWSLRVPLDAENQATFTATPAIVDGVVYVGGWNEVFYALDLDDGDVLWEFAIDEAPDATFGPIVSSAAVADVEISAGATKRLVIFGGGSCVYALDARDGTLQWSRHVGNTANPCVPDGVADPADFAEVESSPLVHDGVVYVGMDVHNQPGTRTNGVRGGVLALDAATGAQLWKYEPEAEDAPHLPPSGCGGVWGSPVIDVETGLLYFGTANCPAVDNAPANQDLPMEEITALDIRVSPPERVWTFRPHQQTPPYEDLDEDFGATPNLFTDANGRKILGAGSKDGSYYALDPATGDVRWNTKVSTPAPNVGGFIGSPAVWDGNVFGATALGTPPAYHSIDGVTGAVRWQQGVVPSYAPSAVVNGVAFAAALDGILKAYDTETGAVLWSSPLFGPGSSGVAVSGDTIVVGSGTSTSDLCAKGRPDSEACFLVFDTLLGQQGGVHAFRLAGAPQPTLGGFQGE